ncbi:MAG: ParB/RepB/Spo0J family partition protein [Patescibacteria group bacterium]
MTDTIKNLPINHLQTNPFQPRGKIRSEELNDLANSIKECGILEPLVVAHTPAGYQIIAGERRWRAAQKIGLKEIPVIIKKTTPKGMLEMAIVENVQRVNLSAIERAKAFQQLSRDFAYNNADISKRIGKSPAFVSNTLRLIHLPDAIKDGLSGKQITEGHARALLGISKEEDMINCYKVILKENASVRRAEELSRIYRGGVRQTKNNENNSKRMPTVDPQIENWKHKVKTLFEDNAKVKLTRSERQTRLTITFNGSTKNTQANLERIMKILEKEAN